MRSGPKNEARGSSTTFFPRSSLIRVCSAFLQQKIWSTNAGLIPSKVGQCHDGRRLGIRCVLHLSSCTPSCPRFLTALYWVSKQGTGLEEHRKSLKIGLKAGRDQDHFSLAMLADIHWQRHFYKFNLSSAFWGAFSCCLLMHYTGWRLTRE